MAATDDEQMELLLDNFDQIVEDVKGGVAQLQSLQSTCNAEAKLRESLQLSVNSLRSDNERLAKLYTESLNKVADQLERRTSRQSLKELERVKVDCLRKENECREAMESLKEDCACKVKDLENQIRGLLAEKVADKETIKQIQEDLDLHKTHLESLRRILERVEVDTESRYQQEIQDLKDCVMIEHEEKNDLYKKIQNLEKELLISRTKLSEHQRDLTSNRNVETLKQKIMKLRKENEVLKRQLQAWGCAISLMPSYILLCVIFLKAKTLIS